MFVSVLYPFTYNNKQAYTIFYEFIVGNKYEVLESKAKLWVFRAEPPVFGDFCSFFN